MRLYRYSRWDGSQRAFPIDEEELMAQLSEQLVTHGDVSKALRMTAQKGLRDSLGQNGSGVQDMLRRLQAMRQETLERYNLEHILDSVTRTLQDIVDAERRGIAKRITEARGRFTYQRLPESRRLKSRSEGGGREAGSAAPTPLERLRLLESLEEVGRKNQEFLDNLPGQPAPAIQKLTDYEFMDDEAKTKFGDLVEALQDRVLGSSLRNLCQDPKGLRPGQLASLKDMLLDINRLLEVHFREGEPASHPYLDRFLRMYGDLFGSSPPSGVDDLTEVLNQQTAPLQSLLKSLPPDLRMDLQQTTSSTFHDEELRAELVRFVSNLEHAHSGGRLTESFLFVGDEPLGLEEALEAISRLQKIKELERQLKKTQNGDYLAHVNPGLVRELMGEDCRRELEELRLIADVLEGAGYIRRVGSRFELTSKGIRKMGNRALLEIFARVKKDRTGQHRGNSTGSSGDLLEDAKRYQYGDPFHLHLQRSVMNAIRRNPGTPVRMCPEDFEIHETEQTLRAATVLMLDLSLSMALRGNFLVAKKVALALDNLIRTQFPRDSLNIVGFSTYAREVRADQLAYLTWDEFDPYTNIQQGLTMARKLLARSSGCTKQIIMISDGEPTAHMEGEQLYLQYPPNSRTIQETLKEVKRCTRQEVRINTFMLERRSFLLGFVDQMARINRGRVFYTRPDKLGEYLLVDYLTSRRRQLV